MGGRGVDAQVGQGVGLLAAREQPFHLRPVGGEPIKGVWGLRMGVLNFSPAENLQPATTDEVILPKGGITDLVRNPLAEDFKSTFTTK